MQYLQNFIEQRIKFDQKVKISNAQLYSNEIYKTVFSFETQFKEKQQSHDHSLRNQLNLKTQTLQCTHVNEH